MKSTAISFPLLRRIAVFVLMTAAAGALATTAYTRDTSGTVGFTCDDGDRFIIEYLPGHVRLRHGTGVFALTEEAGGSNGGIYSDGQVILRTGEQHATLQRRGAETPLDCKAETAGL